MSPRHPSALEQTRRLGLIVSPRPTARGADTLLVRQTLDGKPHENAIILDRTLAEQLTLILLKHYGTTTQ